MKRSFEGTAFSQKKLKKQGIRDLFRQRLNKLKKGPITCPFCREVLNGMAEMGSHLKDHCR